MQPITKFIDPKILILPKDFKADPKNLQMMIESVKQQGIFHPPLVKDNLEVIAGKLRVAACRAAGLNPIECKVVASNLSTEEYKIFSLHENLKRYNLPWYDQVVKEKELHDLRQLQQGVAKSGPKREGWSLRDTAQELNMSFGILSEDIRIAEAIALDPSLRRVEDKTTAKRIILERFKRDNQQVAAVSRTSIATNECLMGDSSVVLEAFPNNTFDCCITDPPWMEFKDASLTRDQFTLPVFKQIFRVLKNNSFLYAFVSTQDWVFYSVELAKLGFAVQQYPIIWVKLGSLSYGTLSWQYQRDYELIIVAVKGSPALTAGMQSSIISTKIVPSGLLTHPNEKPIEVIETLLDQSTYEGSLVLDPFAGSFAVPAACKKNKRRYVAIEKEGKFFAAGQERMKK